MSETISIRIIQRNTMIWSIDYLGEKPFESVWRNRHMNAFGDSIENKMLDTENKAFNPKNKGKKPTGDLKEVESLICDFISYLNWSRLEGITKIDLLHLLTHTAQIQIKNLIESSTLGVDLVIAIIVDLINYIGVRMGVDYGLYTRDVKYEKST